MPTLPSEATVKLGEHSPKQNDLRDHCPECLYVTAQERLSRCLCRKMASKDGEGDLDLGHKGAGDNCLDKMSVYAMNGAAAGV